MNQYLIIAQELHNKLVKKINRFFEIFFQINVKDVGDLNNNFYE